MTLPDYARLAFLINNSGVAKWNPALYDILRQIVFAVQQSQKTILGTTLPNFVESVAISAIQIAQRTLTNAEILSINTAANFIEFIPAPGTGRIIIPLYSAGLLNLITSYTNTGINVDVSNISFRYSDGAGGISSIQAGAQFLATGSGNTKQFAVDADLVQATVSNVFNFQIIPGNDPTNKSINITTNAIKTINGGGNAGNTYKITMGYVIVPVPT